jgi:hypothetical protein
LIKKKGYAACPAQAGSSQPAHDGGTRAEALCGIAPEFGSRPHLSDETRLGLIELLSQAVMDNQNTPGAGGSRSPVLDGPKREKE